MTFINGTIISASNVQIAEGPCSVVFSCCFTVVPRLRQMFYNLLHHCARCSARGTDGSVASVFLLCRDTGPTTGSVGDRTHQPNVYGNSTSLILYIYIIRKHVHVLMYTILDVLYLIHSLPLHIPIFHRKSAASPPAVPGPRRLWCVFEVAAYRVANPKGKLTFQPVAWMRV